MMKNNLTKINSPTTIKSILHYASSKLNRFSSADLDAQVLLAFVLQKPRSYLFTWPEQQLSNEQMQQYLQSVERRLQGEPVAYITGEREFWSLVLHVTPATLIPRVETELLVELVLKFMPKDEEVHILDLGTGSGAIAIALAMERPYWQIVAVDKSMEALSVAEGNAKKYAIKNINFIHSNWFSALDKQQFHCIIANPPYIADNDIHLPELCYEPKTALIADDNGLDDLKTIILEAARWLYKNGYLMLEHGFSQASVVAQFMHTNGYQQVTTYKDLAHHDRVTVGLIQSIAV